MAGAMVALVLASRGVIVVVDWATLKTVPTRVVAEIVTVGSTGPQAISAHDFSVAIEESGMGIRSIALGRDSLIPVMIWRSGFLHLDRLQPRVFPRGLIKMPVNTDEFFHEVNPVGAI